MVLTAGDGGGKDQINELFGSKQRGLGLKDWRIWDYDQTCVFLDDAADIRTAYAAWITPGDVLAAAFAALATPARAKLLSDALATFIAKDLYSDQYANLEQAGHSIDDKIALARVFVDLPAGEAQSVPMVNRQFRGPDSEPFLARIIDAAKDKLDAASIDERRKSSTRSGLGRFVLVGGPGQGKTTLGQFTCQVFRAAILRDRPKQSLAPEVRNALAGIVEQCASEGIDLPSTKRFPIRIILSELADAIQANSQLSLISYMASRVSAKSSFEIGVDDLRQWIGKYPWLIVLDGLDEVPASSNRDAVLNAIADFWTDVATQNGDVLVIATTRPQGYGEDFSPGLYTHLSLRPLNQQAAMRYAARLVAERYGNEPDRSHKILGRLRQAVLLPSTAKLMTSPLQVTIMATLVDQIGQPPQDRWRLFHDYYEVIFRREMERDIPAARLLRERRKDIDTIHNWVALLLQVETERSGGAEAKLDSTRFRAIVAARLHDEGYQGAQQRQLVEEIVEAATNRLVFLVGLQAGQIGFEIRSLQEFMAAEALMEGADIAVQSRLERIAPITSWRNVFLFAAGRCFADAQHLRDTIIRICMQMNGGSPASISRLGRAGSRVAADLLTDGVAARQPKYGKLLMSCASELLAPTAFPDDAAALAAACTPPLDEMFREELESVLRNRPFEQALAAWSLLFQLISQGTAWAQELLKRHVPPETEKVLLLSRLRSAFPTTFFTALGEEVIYRLPVTLMAGRAWQIRPSRKRLKGPNVWLGHQDISPFPVRIGDSPSAGVVSSVNSAKGIRHLSQSMTVPEGAHPSWIVLAELRKASEHLSAASLAGALRRIAALGQSVVLDEPQLWFSWPVEALLSDKLDGPALLQMADQLQQGRYGDITNWLAAEERLRTNRITSHDIAAMTDELWPIHAALSEVGAPVAAVRWSYVGNQWPFDVLFELLEAAPEGSACRRLLARRIQNHLFFDENPTPSVSASRLATVLHLAGDPTIDAAVLECLCERGIEPEHFSQLATVVAETLWVGPKPYKALTAFLVENQRALGAIGDAIIAKLIARSESGIHRNLTVTQRTNDECTLVDAQIAALSGAEDSDMRQVLIGHAANPKFADLMLDMVSRRDLDESTSESMLNEINQKVPVTDVYRRSRLATGVRQVLDRRRSGLEQPDVWSSMELPPNVLPVLRRDG